MQRRLCITALVVIACFWSVARADDLEGRLFLGERLDINMELKEGLFSELLRYMKLRKSPRRVVNLSSLGKTGDFVFIGDDLKLYFSSENKDGGSFQIGSASRLWKFSLDDDVEFLNVPDISSVLDPNGGSVDRKLRVRTAKDRPRAHTVQQANFEFWLEELVFEYDRYDPRKKTEENYPYICDAIHTALPKGDDATREQLENLVHLERHARLARGMDLVPLRTLIEELQKEIEASGASTELQERYRVVRDLIFKRSEDS